MQKKITLAAAIVVLVLGGGALFYLFFKYLAGVLLPFVLGWGLAMLVRRPAAWLREKTRLPLGVARLLLVALCAVLLGTVLVLGVRGIFREISHFLSRFGSDSSLFAERVREWLASIPIIGEKLSMGSALEEGISMLLSALPTIVARLADVLPAFFFTLGVGVIAAIYFCLDLDRIHAALSSRLKAPHNAVFRFFKDSALRAALSVLRAQGILTLVAFALLLFGFVLLDVKYPLLLSGLFALLDFLPVLGVGLFLVPWGVFSLLSGARVLGVGLLVLFGVIAVLRQFLEPRVLGHGYGLHPLVTLLSLYAGGRLFGLFGLLVFPMITLLLFEMLFSDEDKKSSAS
ncbi:MAG: AI-2E family transporter [Ruminococcaceae bacterium]|nr:AI-2E family transporter [Oscillospiraceae bacterium]